MLSDWLVRTLEPLCDADPAVLSKYVLALVQNNPEKEGLRETCLTKLEEFLGDETHGFVDRLFTALRSKSYMQKPTPAPPAPQVAEMDRPRPRDGEEELDDRRNKRARRSRSRSRDRMPPREPQREPRGRYDDRRDLGPQNGRGPMPGRRGGRFDGWNNNMPPHMQPQQPWGMYPRPMYPPMMNPEFDGGFDHRRPPHAHPKDGPKPDPEAATLRVDNADPKFINVTKLSAHFSKFGDVVNVQMRPQFRCAFVQFATVDMAKRAFHSPMPVCNNRFISVHFAKHAPKDLGDIPPEQANPEARRQEMLEHGKKVLEEKRQLLEQDKALQAQRESLLKNQLAQYEKLLATLAAKNMLPPAEKTAMETKIADLQAQLAQLTMPPLERLQAELHALEQQEKQLKPPTAWKKRGIDNRTRWVHLAALPEAARDQSVLEQHFAPYGAIDAVVVAGADAYVQFRERFAGEKAMKLGHTYLDTPLTMAWSDQGPPAATE
ncbi:RNA-binding protein [Achlya hypogyna]|uniref:RNA-binding protein n=1 Tax=Achlya hypogyna TaxID=1202772 RepID=A0A1V9YNU2_ACHHY|nr:RNA-binding protein [Achlya hypogyna]